jgi:outer membrane biosynthesis protein TonB
MGHNPLLKSGRAWVLALALLAAGGARAADDDLFRVTPEKAASTLEDYFQKATDDIAQCRIRDARQEMSLIGFKINRYKNVISRDEKKKYELRLAGLNGTVKQKVDSLVKVNLAIIKKDGRVAGNEFRQFLSAQQGLSEAELAAVDEAILQSPASEDEYRPQVHVAARPENVAPASAAPTSAALAPPSAYETPSQPVARQPIAPAPPAPAPPKPEKVPVVPPPPPVVEQPQPQKPVPPQPVRPEAPVFSPREQPTVEPVQKSVETVQEKPEAVVIAAPPADEIDKGKTRASATAAKIRALLDENKTDEAMTVFQIYQMNLQRFCAGGAYAELKSAVETAFTRDRDERARAQGTAQAIERLLDQDRAFEASAELNRSRETLRQYLDKQEFRGLDSKVVAAVADAGRKQAAAQGLLRDIRGLLDAGKVEDAYVSFDKSRSDLERGLSKEDMAALKKDVAAAYNTLQDKKRLSELCNRDIVSLIKAWKGAAAFSQFTENRSLLQKYLDPKAFDALETDANKANRGFLKSQERARSTLFGVDSLLGAGRVQAAYDLFEDANAQLRRDLANDQRFFDTKDRLMKAYDTFKADKALAVQTARKIEYLNSRKEGRKADVQYQQEKARLQKFLEPAAFDKLDQAVRRAKAEYESNYASARLTVVRIEELLGTKKIEQAYKAYEKAEDDLDFYFNDDKAITELGKRVKGAYAGLQERKQWALSQVRQIQRLIEKKRGNQAYARFQETRAGLAEYTDAKTMSSLDTDVARANRAYAAAQSRAEAGAARIRSMIVQNQVEDAYAAFDTSESDLEFYLEPNAFSAIKTLVEKFNSALQGKKQEALRTTGTINRLIDRDLGDSAFVLFKQNDASLSKYLKAKTYKAVAARVAKAKEEWEKNCRQVTALSDRLKELLDRDRVEAAYGEFNDKRDFLEHYLDKVSFGRLETAVRAPYEFFLQKRKQARTTVSVLRRMIGQNRGTEARAEFESWDRDLGQYLPQEEYTDIKTRIAQAYSKSVLGRRDAKATSDKIRRLLNGGRTTEAYRIYQDARSDLEMYSSRFEFDRLQTEVISAYDEQEDKRKQVKDYAKKLRQLVSKNKQWDAYKGFTANRRNLSEWLDAGDFDDLEHTVVGAYEKARTKTRSGHKGKT